MKALQSKVNIVPIIAKADTLTPTECRRLKAKILQELNDNHIQIYRIPECDSDEDDEFKTQNKLLKVSLRVYVFLNQCFVICYCLRKRFRLLSLARVKSTT